jgi:hypothetical protein
MASKTGCRSAGERAMMVGGVVSSVSIDTRVDHEPTAFVNSPACQTPNGSTGSVATPT